MTRPTITITPERPALLEGYGTELKLLIQIKAPERPQDHQRPPMNLALVIDRSGSMKGSPLEEAKRCAQFVHEQLSHQDQISLITYNDCVEVLAAAEPAQPNQGFAQALASIEATGATNLFKGWRYGAEQLERDRRDFMLNRVFLLSDGCLNRGLRDREEIAAYVTRLSRAGITTSTYGLSEHFDELVMRLMAERGGGQFRYGERVEDLFEAFVEELDLLNELYASQLLLKLHPAEGVKLSCHNHFLEHEGALVLPDLAYGAELWAGLTLSVSPEAAQRGTPLLHLELSHPELKLHEEARFDALPLVPPAAYGVITADEAVALYFAELLVSSLKEQAARASRVGDWPRVEALLKEMRALPLNARQREEIEVIAELALRRQGQLFAKETMSSSSKARRSMKLNALHYTQAHPAQELPSYMCHKACWGRALGSSGPQDSKP
jgi:Ca-activated chloride channel family protein